MKITTFDRGNLPDIHSAVRRALEPVAAEYGVNFTVKAGAFDRNFWRFTTEVRVGGAEEQAARNAAAAQHNFVAYCDLFGLKPEHFGQVFLNRGEQYRITGLKVGRRRAFPLLGAPKFPIMAVRVRDGKGFKFSARATGLVQKTEA